MRRPSDAEFAQLIAKTAELVKESRRLLDQLQQHRDAERRILLTATIAAKEGRQSADQASDLDAPSRCISR